MIARGIQKSQCFNLAVEFQSRSRQETFPAGYSNTTNSFCQGKNRAYLSLFHKKLQGYSVLGLSAKFFTIVIVILS